MRTHTWLRLLVILGVLLVAVACAQPQVQTQTEVKEVVVTATPAQEETTLERAQRTGVVRVGFANENPYAYATPDGELTGEAVEVARAIFTELGIEEMDGVLTQFGSLIPGLRANRFDVITAGMYITPSRCEQVLFADPEYTIGEGVIVQAGNPYDIHSYEDIAANPDIKVGTGAGWLEFDYMTGVGVAEDQIVTFPDGPAGVAGLQAGQIDAFTGTFPTMKTLVETTNDPNLAVVEDFEAPVIDGERIQAYGGAAFRFEDQDFRDAFNAELQKLKDSGELLDIIGQFEGFGETELPGDVTAEDICPDAYADLG
jgi:polar amino acid transport system substrate-binding protein